MSKETGTGWCDLTSNVPVKGFEKSMLAMNRRPWICDKCGESYPEAPEQCRINQSEPPSTPWICGCKTFHRRRVFCSNSDWLDAKLPIETLAHFLDVFRRCPDMILIIRTKSPENFRTQLESVCRFIEDKGVCSSNEDKTWIWVLDWMTGEKIPPNIILLISDDKRIPELLRIPAACRGLSLEPLLGPVELPDLVDRDEHRQPYRSKIDWLIVGGESGPQARPCNVDWIRSLVEQGKASGIATFVKQLGARPYQKADHTLTMLPDLIRDKKGGDPAEWPKDLQIQQWPKGF